MSEHGCHWEANLSRCPFKTKPTDPLWCQACVDISALRMHAGTEFGAKMFMINSLIQSYGNPKKAKEVFDQLIEYAKTWGAPKVKKEKKSEEEVE